MKGFHSQHVSVKCFWNIYHWQVRNKIIRYPVQDWGVATKTCLSLSKEEILYEVWCLFPSYYIPLPLWLIASLYLALSLKIGAAWIGDFYEFLKSGQHKWPWSLALSNFVATLEHIKFSWGNNCIEVYLLVLDEVYRKHF